MNDIRVTNAAIRSSTMNVSANISLISFDLVSIRSHYFARILFASGEYLVIARLVLFVVANHFARESFHRKGAFVMVRMRIAESVRSAVGGRAVHRAAALLRSA